MSRDKLTPTTHEALIVTLSNHAETYPLSYPPRKENATPNCNTYQEEILLAIKPITSLLEIAYMLSSERKN